MSMIHAVARLARSKGKRPAANRSTCRLSLENLETRCLLAYTFYDLGTFGGNISHGYAVNSAGQVAGDAEGTGGPKKNHPFLYANGVKTELPTPGYDYGVARALNNRGQVVGFMYTLGDGEEQAHYAFAYQDGVTTNLGALGGNGSQAYGNNDRGQVIGLAKTADDVGHAFLWTRGKMLDIHSLGNESFAYDINNKTQIVGYFIDDTGNKRSFLWHKGYNYDLGDFGGVWSDAWGINETGQVAGYATTADGKNHAYLWNPNTANSPAGTLNNIEIGLTCDESFAYNLNNLGHVVGACETPSGQFRAFVYKDGVMTDLNTLLPAQNDWNFLNYAMAINDQGHITGYGFKKDMTLHAFLMVPDASVPPPTTPRVRPAPLRIGQNSTPSLASNLTAPASATSNTAVAPATEQAAETSVAGTSTQTVSTPAASSKPSDVEDLLVSPLSVARLIMWRP